MLYVPTLSLSYVPVTDICLVKSPSSGSVAVTPSNKSISCPCTISLLEAFITGGWLIWLFSVVTLYSDLVIYAFGSCFNMYPYELLLLDRLTGTLYHSFPLAVTSSIIGK